MTQGNIRSIEKEAFRRRLAQLGENADDAGFADAVYTAISTHGVAAEDFRNAFGLSQDAVDRWTTGKNLPHPLARGKILLWIMEKL